MSAIRQASETVSCRQFQRERQEETKSTTCYHLYPLYEGDVRDMKKAAAAAFSLLTNYILKKYRKIIR